MGRRRAWGAMAGVFANLVRAAARTGMGASCIKELKRLRSGHSAVQVKICEVLCPLNQLTRRWSNSRLQPGMAWPHSMVGALNRFGAWH